MLLVVIQRSTFTKSSWDSYVKFFSEKDGESAEERFLDWWVSLDARSYTRDRAIVRVFEVDHRQERKDLMAPMSPGRLTR